MSEIHGRTVMTDGFPTHLLEAGDRSADDVLLLHGCGLGSTASADWQAFIPELASRYHVIVPDLVGSGQTQHPAGHGEGMRAWLRGRVRQVLSLDWIHPETCPSGPAVSEDFEQKRQHTVLWDCIDQMDDRYRLPMILFYRQGLSAKETALVLNLPVMTVYSRLNTAREMLQKQVRGQVKLAAPKGEVKNARSIQNLQTAGLPACPSAAPPLPARRPARPPAGGRGAPPDGLRQLP